MKHASSLISTLLLGITIAICPGYGQHEPARDEPTRNRRQQEQGENEFDGRIARLQEAKRQLDNERREIEENRAQLNGVREDLERRECELNERFELAERHMREADERNRQLEMRERELDEREREIQRERELAEREIDLQRRETELNMLARTLEKKESPKDDRNDGNPLAALLLILAIALWLWALGNCLGRFDDSFPTGGHHDKLSWTLVILFGFVFGAFLYLFRGRVQIPKSAG